MHSTYCDYAQVYIVIMVAVTHASKLVLVKVGLILHIYAVQYRILSCGAEHHGFNGGGGVVQVNVVLRIVLHWQ